MTDFKYFSSGEFLAGAGRTKYKTFIKQTVAKAEQIFPEHSEIIDTEPINLVHPFSVRYNFRLSVYNGSTKTSTLKEKSDFHLKLITFYYKKG